MVVSPVQKNNDIETLIGKRIQKLRRARGYTQQQFAEIIELSPNYLSDIERGKSSTRLDKLVTIINALECSADDVFTDVIDYGYKVKMSRFDEAIEKLSPEDRKKIFAIIDAYIKNCQ